MDRDVKVILGIVTCLMVAIIGGGMWWTRPRPGAVVPRQPAARPSIPANSAATGFAPHSTRDTPVGGSAAAERPLSPAQDGLGSVQPAANPFANRPLPPAAPQQPSDRTPAPSLRPEPSPTPLPKPQGRVHIGNAKILTQNDGDGHETAQGRVLIVNDGPYTMVDFRLGLEVGGVTYVLVPFEGSTDYPRPIYGFARRLDARRTLDVPVMATGVYRSYYAGSVNTVHLEASIDGPPGIVTDKALVM